MKFYKFLRGISLFFVYPIAFMGMGFLAGVWVMDYFYPGSLSGLTPQTSLVQDEMGRGNLRPETLEDKSFLLGEAARDPVRGETSESQMMIDALQEAWPEDTEAAESFEKISAATEYVLEETDVATGSTVETTWKIPEMYIGMDREQFVEAMRAYGENPPLAERERGFVSLEVRSFSEKRVVVEMFYEYVRPSKSFYLMAKDNYVVVYLEDRETIYLYTDILLTDLPDRLQQDIIQVMYVPDEVSLYDFLETYTS